MAAGNTPEKPHQSDETASKATGHAPVNLDERLRKLESHLAAKGVGLKAGKEGQDEKTSASVAQAVKLSSEFIAGIVVGAALGWFVDRVAGSSPWGLIVFLFLGFGAGTLNVLRTAGYVAENGKNVDNQQHKEK